MKTPENPTPSSSDPALGVGPFGMTRSGVTRRQALKGLVAATGAGLAGSGTALWAGSSAGPDARRGSPKRYAMKKSINQWAFPYPERMNLRECLELAKDAGFEGIELNYDLENDLSPKSGSREYGAIRKMADAVGIEISGLCSFLFWPYPLTSNDPAKRERGLELAGMIAQAARDLGVENVLVVPGAVHIPWRDDHEPVPNDVCERRAREAAGQLAIRAERLKVSLNMENIFFNGFLMTPMEMNAFVDSLGSANVGVHFDSGNIALFQHAEHWVPILGQRTRNVHLKEFTRKGTDHSLESFRPLLDGTTNWPALTDALDAVGYRGFLTFEYFHPYAHYPEALIYQTSDSLDRILGRRS
jgi:L-ribulose-5-phosphate 3-epimerase